MWDVVILDEAHYLKNPKAQRTRAIYGPGLDLKNSPLEHAAHIWALTGTPLLNGPHELWTHLRALRPELITQPNLGLMSYTVFVQRYCHVRSTSYGFHVVGAKNTTELVQRIAPFTHRKRAKDVLHDLPPLRVTTYELPPSLIEISPELESAMDDLELEHIDDLDDEDLLRAAQNVSQFSTARRLVGMAKVPGVVVMVDDLLQSGARKLIVFAHHRDVIEQLAQGLTDAGHRPLTIWGGTSQKDRDQFIDAFQDGPERVLLLSIEAASEAITLTAASHVIIAEPSPVPARNVQAIARAHRKGQTRNVLAQFVTLPGTFDQRFMELIARKTRDIMRVLDPDLAAPTLAHVGQQGLSPFPDMEDQPI